MAELSEAPFSYQDRLLAFVDVLGFSHLTLDSESDTDALAKVGRLAATNTLFEAFFGQLMINVKAAFFSDSFVVSTGPEEIIYLVREIGCLCRYLLLLGLPCRGGISRGPLHHEGKIIAGPALIRAYQLEHCTAEMPRVILDEAAMQCWRHEFRPGSAHADLETLVKTDAKGIHQLDLFDPGWGESFLHWTDFIPSPDKIPKDHQEFLAMARIQIERGRKTARDDSVRAKYEWLASNCGGDDEAEDKLKPN